DEPRPGRTAPLRRGRNVRRQVVAGVPASGTAGTSSAFAVTFSASIASGGAASSLRNTSTIAATSDPQALIVATTGTDIPPSNRNPATIGASSEPPRPKPIAKPVPADRTCVG